MKEKNLFSFSRLLLIGKRDVIENWRHLLLSLGGLLGALSLIGILCAVSYSSHIASSSGDIMDVEIGWFAVALSIVGIILASSSFKSLSAPVTALPSLMLPASQFEKFLYRWLIAVPLFMIVASLTAYLADWVRVLFTSWVYGVDMSPVDWISEITVKHFSGRTAAFPWVMLLYYLMVQSFFLLGSVVWSRARFIKTFVCLIAIFIIYGRVGMWVYKLMTPDGVYGIVPPQWFNNDEIVFAVAMTILAVITLFNYALCYMRYREAEIINRW